MKITGYALMMMFVLLFAHPLATNSQEPWSLQECIDYALEHNINIKQQKVEADKATNNHRQAKNNLLPSASANLSHSYNFGKTLNLDNYEYVNREFQRGNVDASTQITLFNGRENINAIAQSKFEMLAQLERIKQARYDVTMNIVTYYLTVLSAMEQKQIRQEQLEVTLEQIEQVKEQIEVGKKAKGELLEIKAQAASERAELTTAKNDLSMAYVDLAQIMNLDSMDHFTIERPEQLEAIQNQKIEPTDSVYSSALSDFPTIQQAKYQLESARKGLKIARGKYYPKLSLGAGFYSYYSELSKPSYLKQMRDLNANMGFQLSLSIPIFSQFSNKTRVANARLDLKNTRYQLQQEKQNLYKNIQKARNEAIAAYENYQANQEALESYQEAFHYAEEKYEVGLVDAVEYRIAKNDLSRARSRVSRSKFNFIFRLKILEFYMGKAMEI